MNDMKGSAVAVLAVVVVLLWLAGIFQILAGVIAGTMIVVGMMLTIERLPYFWKFATWGPGRICVLFGTAWVSHAMFGAETIIGMVAMSWSLIFKVLVIDAHKRAMLAEGE